MAPIYHVIAHRYNTTITGFSRNSRHCWRQMECKNTIIFRNLLEVPESTRFLSSFPTTIQRPINKEETQKVKHFAVTRHKINACQRTGLRSCELCKCKHSKHRVSVPEIVMQLQIWWRGNSLVHGSDNIGTGKRKVVVFVEGESIQMIQRIFFLLICTRLSFRRFSGCIVVLDLKYFWGTQF